MMHTVLSAEAQQLVAWTAAGPRSLVLMLGEKERRDRFAYALQRALLKRNMSVRAVAAALNVDPRTVGKWRDGKSLPDIFQTLALAETLKVSENLFRDPPAIPPPPPEPYYPIDEYLLEAAQSGAAEGHRRASTSPQSPTRGTRPRMPARHARVVGGSSEPSSDR